MSIRDWFGLEVTGESRSGQQFDELLTTVNEAMKMYFNQQSASDAKDLIKKVGEIDLQPCDRRFLSWFQDRGLQTLHDFASTVVIDDNLGARIEYEKYMLDMEIGYGVSDDLRSCIMDIVEDLFDIVQQKKTVPKYEYSYNYQKKQENQYLMPKIERVRYDTNSFYLL